MSHNTTLNGDLEEIDLAAAYNAASSQAAEFNNKWSKNGFGDPVPIAKSGKFTKSESELIRKSMSDYCAAKSITVARLCSECEHKSELKGAWMIIARVVPHRSVQSVYRHGIRRCHPFKRGAWSEAETCTLMDLVQGLGKKWSTIQNRLNRSADSCRDKYREMEHDYVKGRWREEETEMLKGYIREHVVGADPETDMKVLAKRVAEEGIQLPWSAISKKMGNRSRLSCFKRWQKMTGGETGDSKRRKEDDDEDSEDSPTTKRIKIEGVPDYDVYTAKMAADAVGLPDM